MAAGLDRKTALFRDDGFLKRTGARGADGDLKFKMAGFSARPSFFPTLKVEIRSFFNSKSAVLAAVWFHAVLRVRIEAAPPPQYTRCGGYRRAAGGSVKWPSSRAGCRRTIPLGRGLGVGRRSGARPWRTCPSPDGGRGRGPADTSYCAAMTQETLGRAGASKASEVPPGPAHRCAFGIKKIANSLISTN